MILEVGASTRKVFTKTERHHVFHSSVDSYDLRHLSFNEPTVDDLRHHSFNEPGLLHIAILRLHAMRWMTGEALVSLNLIAHINSTQVTTFSSLFAHALQSALVSHAQHSLYNRGGHGSGVLELTPAGYLIFLDTELESKICEKTDPNPEPLFIFHSSRCPWGLHSVIG